MVFFASALPKLQVTIMQATNSAVTIA